MEGAIPDPRAHFTATKFGTQVIIFGGYGGSGQVLNELWVLHINSGAGSVRWENLTETLQGTGPSPRFDHAAFIYPITPNSATYDKLLIMGGRDLNTMYQVRSIQQSLHFIAQNVVQTCLGCFDQVLQL